MNKVVPANWSPVHFEEIFTQISTSGKKVKTAEALAKGMFPVVDQGQAFVSGYLDDARLVVSDEKPLIIFGDHTREIKWIDFAFIPGADGVKILKPNSEMNGRFLYFFLRNLPIESKGYARHFKVLRDAEYWVLPLAEQTRIAQKLDELLTQVDTLEARIDAIPALLKRFRQSVLAAAVSGRLTEDWRAASDIGEPRTTWQDTKLSELCALVTSGSRGWADYYSDSGAIFIRSQDINTDDLDITDTAFVKLPESSEGKRTRVQAQDILITITGANVGKVARVKQALPESYVSQHVALVRLQSSEYAPFIEFYLKDIGSGRGELTELAYGGGKPGLNLSNIRDLVFALPSRDEQTEIVRRVEQLFAFADQLEAKVSSAKSRIDHLTQSILAKAFRGELVPQDPNDEPASVLLERIQAQRASTPKARRGRKSA